ncbi:hypothetical protein NMG60_11003074 [Bertholletia excelsa]
MEKGFQAMLVGGQASAAFSPPALTADDACLNAMYPTSAQQFLSVTDEKYLLHSLDYGYGAAPVASQLTFGFPVEGFLASRSEEVGDCLGNGGDTKLKMLKHEPSNDEGLRDELFKPTDFISKIRSGSISMISDWRFQQLPDLRSLEQGQDGFAFAESSRKRAKSFSSASSQPGSLGPISRNLHFANHIGCFKPPEIQPPAVFRQSALAKQRRRKISDKTRCLQKLMPWDKKMDYATMLEEAYKYVKFLQAQVRVLQSMPSDCSSFVTQNYVNNFFGRLGTLNRQQLLQVLVNSPAAQTMLYSQGCCVYSIEQLHMLKKVAERNALYQQMAFDPSTLP